MKTRLLLLLVLAAALLVLPAAGQAAPDPYRQAQSACERLNGFFGVYEGGGGYFCNFGGSPPPHADKQWFGPTYVKICERNGGSIFEEFPPPYSYSCTIPAP